MNTSREPFAATGADKPGAVSTGRPAAAPEVREGTENRSANHLWNMATTSHPVTPPVVADLSEEQKTDTHHMLKGMLRERSGGEAVAVLTSEINIGIGVK